MEMECPTCKVTLVYLGQTVFDGAMLSLGFGNPNAPHLLGCPKCKTVTYLTQQELKELADKKP